MLGSSCHHFLEKSLCHVWDDSGRLFSEQYLHFRSLAFSRGDGGGEKEAAASDLLSLPLSVCNLLSMSQGKVIRVQVLSMVPHPRESFYLMSGSWTEENSVSHACPGVLFPNVSFP